MGEKLKSIGSGLIVFLVFAAVLALIGLLIGGASWMSEKLLPWFAIACWVALALVIVVFLPLSFLRQTRAFASVSLYCVSYLFGATAWMEGLLVTLAFWGVFGVIIGLFFGGIGVVPIGMLALIFHGLWARLVEMIVLIALTLGCRFWPFWITAKVEKEEKETAEILGRAEEYIAWLKSSEAGEE